jgi:hypothetical protein
VNGHPLPYAYALLHEAASPPRVAWIRRSKRHLKKERKILFERKLVFFPLSFQEELFLFPFFFFFFEERTGTKSNFILNFAFFISIHGEVLKSQILNWN